MEYVWDAYKQLSQTRNYGMAANRITFVEIQAFAQTMLHPLSVWEVALIRRIDDAIMRILAGEVKAKTKPNSQIPADRPKDIKSFFQGLKSRMASKGPKK